MTGIAAFSGVYVDVVECNSNVGCFMNTTISGDEVTTFGITHPVGYTGVETIVPIRVCIDPSAAAFEPALRRAIALWQNLEPIEGNCEGSCNSVTLTGEADGIVWHAESAILHELGHCAVALDHVNRLWDRDLDAIFEITNFTMSAEAAIPGGVDAGVDGIEGTFDDIHIKVGGGSAEDVHWFRSADNDPAVVDFTTIEFGPYRSSEASLPFGHSWAASGNLFANQAPPIFVPETQAVMFSTLSNLGELLGLSADDANMVKMAMTGIDRAAGTSDDYEIDLSFVGDCANTHELKFTAEPGPVNLLGRCTGFGIEAILPGNPLLAQHFVRVPVGGQEPSIIMNLSETWDLGTPDLSFTGSCPGAVSLSARELVPGGGVAVLTSSMTGSTPVPAGNPCGGTPTGLDSPSLVTTLTADSGGKVQLTSSLGQGLCGAFVQLLDLTTCVPSNVDVIP